ncbi:MAG: hypothetical protein C4547_16670 [Phycisphaerales bacterium]|nr:MAG: hypothetical protein C4547_16670 [Phycisphaerales bacterium]
MHDHAHDHPHPYFDEAPLDAASQSLADALRASFQILKYLMFGLVIVYLFSGVTFVQPSEKAVVARVGRILDKVHDPGLLLAWPYPIDDVIRLPVAEAKDLVIDSHMLALSDEEKKRGLTFVQRGHGRGLNPVTDGALLTGDKGLVHVQWVATYKIDKLSDYIRNLQGRNREAAEGLLTALVEHAAIDVASSMRAEDVYRRRLEEFRVAVRNRVNADLEALESGVTLTDLKVPVSIVPIQVRDDFEETQRAENRRRTKIQEAEKEQTRILNDAAGSAYRAVVAALGEIEQARLAGDEAVLTRKEAQLEQLLEGEELSGAAGRMIAEARGRSSRVVGAIENDLREYLALLPEYEHNARLLFARKWDVTRNIILNNPEVTKIYRPAGALQFRVKIGPDPEHEREAETDKYKQELESLAPGVHEAPVIVP